MSYRVPFLLALPLLSAAAMVLKGPPDPLRPSTAEDGVGPLTRRRYWVEVVASGRTAEDIAEHWRNHLPDHVPKGLIWFRGLDHPVPPVRQGDRLWIRIFLIRRGRVLIEHVDALGFRARTLRLHPEAGTTDFRVFPGDKPGELKLQIESLLRSNSRFDRLMYVLGIHAAQSRSWHLMLRSVAQYAGGQTVNHGTESLETPGVAHSFHRADGPAGAC